MLPERKSSVVAGSVASITGLCLAMTSVDIKDRLAEAIPNSKPLADTAKAVKIKQSKYHDITSLPALTNSRQEVQRKQSLGNAEKNAEERGRNQRYVETGTSERSRKLSNDEMKSHERLRRTAYYDRENDGRRQIESYGVRKIDERRRSQSYGEAEANIGGRRRSDSIVATIISERRRSQSHGETSNAGQWRRESRDESVNDGQHLRQPYGEALRKGGNVQRLEDWSKTKERRNSQDASGLSRIDEESKYKWTAVEKGRIAKETEKRRGLNFISEKPPSNDSTFNQDGTTHIYRVNARKNSFFDPYVPDQIKKGSFDLPRSRAKNEMHATADAIQAQKFQQQNFQGANSLPFPAKQRQDDSEKLLTKNITMGKNAEFRPQIARKRSSLECLSVAPTNITFELDSLPDSKSKVSYNPPWVNDKGVLETMNAKGSDEIKHFNETWISKRSSLEKLPTRKLSLESSYNRLLNTDQSLLMKQENAVSQIRTRKISLERVKDGSYLSNDIIYENKANVPEIYQKSNRQGSPKENAFMFPKEDPFGKHDIQQIQALDGSKEKERALANNKAIYVSRSSDLKCIDTNYSVRADEKHSIMQKGSSWSGRRQLSITKNPEKLRYLAGAPNKQADLERPVLNFAENSRDFPLNANKYKQKGGTLKEDPEKSMQKDSSPLGGSMSQKIGERERKKDKFRAKNAKIDNERLGAGQKQHFPSKRQRSGYTMKQILRKQVPYKDDDECYSDNENWKNVKVIVKDEKIKGIMKKKRQNKAKNVTFCRKVKKIVLYCM